MNKRRGRILLAIVAYNVFLKKWFRRKISELFTTLRDVLSKLEAGKVAVCHFPSIITISFYASQAIVKSTGAQIRNLRI